MLDRFQNLPTALRVAISLGLVVVVLGVVVLLARLNPTSPTGEDPAASPVTSGTTAPSTPAPEATLDPSKLGPTDLAPTAPANELYGKNRKYSDSQMNAAVGVAKKAVLAFCRYSPKQSAAQWVEAQRPYYEASRFPYAESDYVSIIQNQQCSITDVKPQQQTKDGLLLVAVAAQEATIYQAGAPIVPNSGDGKASYYYPLGGTLSMKLVSGKWYVDSYNVEQQGSN